MHMDKSDSDISQAVRALQDRYFKLVDAEIAHLRAVRFHMEGVEDRSYDYKMMINSLHRAKDLFDQVIEEYLAKYQAEEK